MLRKVVLLCAVVLYGGGATFESLVQKALDYDNNLKMIALDEGIYEEEIQSVNAAYYPSLSLGLNAQFTENLDAHGSGVASVDNTVFSDVTQYETSGSLILNYTLYDFGVRASQKAMFEQDRDMVRYRLTQAQRKMLLELFEMYKELLLRYGEREYYQSQRTIKYRLYRLMKRLYDAGEIDKLELSEYAIALLQLDESIERLKGEYALLLSRLSFYTGETYGGDFVPESFEVREVAALSYEQSELYFQNMLTLQKKEYELSQLNASQWPQLRVYGKYNYYGSNACSLWCAFDDMSEKNYVVGMGVSWTLFEGFKYNSQKQKLRLELEKLQLQNEQQRREFAQNQNLLHERMAQNDSDLNATKTALNALERRNVLSQNLHDVKERDTISMLNDRLEALQKRYEYDKLLLDRHADAKELELRSLQQFSYYEKEMIHP